MPARIPILRAHSCFSFGRGVLSLESLCRTASERRVTHLALVDTDGLYGFVDFVRIARSYGIVPVAGATLLFEEGAAVLLGETREGYSTLCKAVSAYHALPKRSLLLLAERVRAKDLLAISEQRLILEGAMEWCGAQNVFAAFSPGPDSDRIEKLAKRLGIVATFAPLVYLAIREERTTHVLQRAIALRTSLDGVPPEELWPIRGLFPDRKEIRTIAEEWPSEWKTAADIAERCAMTWEFRGPILPRFCKTNEEAARRLRALAINGASDRYDDSPPPELLPRLEHELDVIISRGLADYFLLVHNIVHDNYATCGRGSAASSLVSYCLGITHVDPIAADLYFERFLGPGRTDIPDIDVDFPWDERPEVLKRVFASRPLGKVALVANHVTFRTKAAIRETGRVLGLPEKQLSELTRHAARRWGREDSMEKVANQFSLPNLGDPEILARLLQMASAIRGLPRHLSRHCGGVVIVSGGVDQVAPFQPLPDGLQVIQWKKDQAEDAGLVKIDLLGNRSLSVVRDAIAFVTASGSEELSYAKLNPLNDPETRDLLARGDSVGIFYVESPAMRQLQIKASSGEFESLVVHSSLIRPAANQWISEYVRRLRGGEYEGLDPFLDELLSESRGILCYQEDVMRVATEMAGFSHSQADQLRRTLSGKKGVPLEELMKAFKDGLRSRGLSEPDIATIWSMVESFSGYSFCKAHSASYALVSFKSAYLKAHYPAEFMAALLNNGGGYYSTQAYISELRRMGLSLSGPDINLSAVDYSPHANGVTVGLKQLRELSSENAKRIVGTRDAGPFHSMDDLVQRCPLPVPAIGSLIQSGAFDSIHGPGCRRPLLRRLAGMEPSTRRQSDLTLFPSPPDVYPVPPTKNLARFQEMEALGFPVNGHPLDLINIPSTTNPQPASLLPSLVGQKVTLLGWFVTHKPVSTRNGKEMAFVSFEDRETLYETVLFPQQYRNVAKQLRSGRAYIVSGKVAEEWGSQTVEVEELQLLRGIEER